MPDFCRTSAPARLIEIRPSRWLWLWSLARDLLLALSALMVSVSAGIAVALLLFFFSRRRRRATPTVIVITRDGYFDLPNENRSDLTLMTESQSGPGWLRLSFSDRPGQRLLLLRDQVDAGDWRVLRIAILEGR